MRIVTEWGTPSGRKRQLLVGVGHRLWFAHAHGANVGDGPAGLFLAADILCFDQRLKKYMESQAYNGVFADKMKEFGIDFEKASRPESTKGFAPVAKRWVAERTIVDKLFPKTCQGV